MSFWASGIYLVIVAAFGCIVLVVVMLMTRGMGGKKRKKQGKSKIKAISENILENDTKQLDTLESVIEPKQLLGPNKPAIAQKPSGDKDSRSTKEKKAKAGNAKKPQATDAFYAAVQEIENGTIEENPQATDAFLAAVQEIESGGKEEEDKPKIGEAPKATEAFLAAVQEIESGGKEEEDKPKILDALSAVVQEIDHSEKKKAVAVDKPKGGEDQDIAAKPFDIMSVFEEDDDEESPLGELAQTLEVVEVDDLRKLSRELCEETLGRT